MQYSEFEKQVDRLRSVYSSGSLNPERIKVWWDRFKGERAEVFESALNHVIAEATTQALPAMSKIAEACGFYRTSVGGTAMRELPPAHDCNACRDFGFRFDGDTVVACPACRLGKVVSPAELVRQQGLYDKGRALLPSRESLKTFIEGEWR